MTNGYRQTRKSLARNGTHFNKVMHEYVLESITNDGYSSIPLKGNKEKMVFLAETFRAEYGYQAKRLGLQKACEEWARGLPSILDVVFYDYDICNLAVERGVMFSSAPDDTREAIVADYWTLLGLKLALLIGKAEKIK